MTTLLPAAADDIAGLLLDLDLEEGLLAHAGLQCHRLDRSSLARPGAGGGGSEQALAGPHLDMDRRHSALGRFGHVEAGARFQVGLAVHAALDMPAAEHRLMAQGTKLPIDLGISGDDER